MHDKKWQNRTQENIKPGANRNFAPAESVATIHFKSRLPCVNDFVISVCFMETDNKMNKWIHERTRNSDGFCYFRCDAWTTNNNIKQQKTTKASTHTNKKLKRRSITWMLRKHIKHAHSIQHMWQYGLTRTKIRCDVFCPPIGHLLPPWLKIKIPPGFCCMQSRF